MGQAKQFLLFLTSAEGQAIYQLSGFRPTKSK
jgi:hypothetical protein